MPNTFKLKLILTLMVEKGRLLPYYPYGYLTHEQTVDFFYDKLNGGGIDDEIWRWRVGINERRRSYMVEIEGLKFDSAFYEEAAEISMQDYIDVAVENTCYSRSLSFRDEAEEYDEDGPGIDQWLRVIDSDQELCDFYSKCNSLGFPTSGPFDWPGVEDELHCSFPEFKIKGGSGLPF